MTPGTHDSLFGLLAVLAALLFFVGAVGGIIQETEWRQLASGIARLPWWWLVGALGLFGLIAVIVIGKITEPS